MQTVRDEKCTCSHGGEDNEDHTEGNGCERRGCWCQFWPQDGDEQPSVTFENTNNQIEYTQWYAVTGAPAMENQVQQGKSLVPVVAKWTFKDGEVTGVFLTGRAVKKDGSISESSQMIPGIYHWNQQEWPDWLTHLYKVAINDYRANRAAEYMDAVTSVKVPV